MLDEARKRPSRGSLLKEASCQFAAMLMEELRDIGGYRSPRSLMEALESAGLATERVKHYISTNKKKIRGPSRAALQQLENKVAKILRRPAHIVVIYDANRLYGSGDPCETMVKISAKYPRWMEGTKTCLLELGYDANWPTYRRLKMAGEEAKARYAWQWGVLWEQGAYLREALGVHQDQSIDAYIAERVQQAKVHELASQRERMEQIRESRSIADRGGWLFEWNEHAWAMMDDLWSESWDVWGKFTVDTCRNSAGMAH